MTLSGGSPHSGFLSFFLIVVTGMYVPVPSLPVSAFLVTLIVFSMAPYLDCFLLPVRFIRLGALLWPGMKWMRGYIHQLD